MPLKHVHYERPRLHKPATRKTAAPRPPKPPPAVIPPPPSAPLAEAGPEQEELPAAPPPPPPAPAPVDPGNNFTAAATPPNTAAADFERRFDTIQTHLPVAPAEDPLPDLLDRALTLLESLSRHPALRDYADTQRKLEEIEQRLGSGAYPQ